MARPRKNAVLLEMSGALKKDPGRYKDRAVSLETNGPIGDAPEEFKTGSGGIQLTALWNKLVSEAPIGLLTASDRESLANACRMGVEAKRIGKSQIRAMIAYERMLRGMGMTPEGRAARGIGGKVATVERKNPLDDFTKRKSRRSA